MNVTVGISNHHVHLKEEDFKTLFGDLELTPLKPLLQPGNFVSALTVTVQTKKGMIPNVRIIGPNRTYTQVEISRTEAYQLGLDPSIRKSGDLNGTSIVTLIGPNGSVETDGCILAYRHIHLTHEQQIELGLAGLDEVSVEIKGPRGGILDHVTLKYLEEAIPEIHLDTDEGNALGLKTGDTVTLLPERKL